jgi:hypothetical protein
MPWRRGYVPICYVFVAARQAQPVHRRLLAAAMFVTLVLVWGELATAYFRSLLAP